MYVYDISSLQIHFLYSNLAVTEICSLLSIFLASEVFHMCGAPWTCRITLGVPASGRGGERKAEKHCCKRKTYSRLMLLDF